MLTDKIENCSLPIDKQSIVIIIRNELTNLLEKCIKYAGCTNRNRTWKTNWTTENDYLNRMINIYTFFLIQLTVKKI